VEEEDELSGDFEGTASNVAIVVGAEMSNRVGGLRSKRGRGKGFANGW